MRSGLTSRIRIDVDAAIRAGRDLDRGQQHDPRSRGDPSTIVGVDGSPFVIPEVANYHAFGHIDHESAACIINAIRSLVRVGSSDEHHAVRRRATGIPGGHTPR